MTAVSAFVGARGGWVALRSRARRWLTIIAFNLALTLVLVVLVDVVAWLTGVTSHTFGFRGQNRGGYPPGYFIADDTLGHDASPGASAHFVWGRGEGKAEIFTNRFGCMDEREEFPDGYVYIAGDSVAWGYAPYPKKFGTLLEQRLGVAVAKCAVTHTGQEHQRRKLARFVKSVGRAPSLVVAVWTANDPSNDWLFPEATVIDGSFVNQAVVRHEASGPVRVRFTPEQLRARLLDVGRLTSGGGFDEIGTRHGLRSWLSDYSLTVNILYRVRTEIALWRGGVPDYEADMSALPPPALRTANERALRALRDDATALGADLFVLLFSWQHDQHIASVADFLSNEQIPYASVGECVQRAKRPRQELHWRHDGHPNEAGNELIADCLQDALARASLPRAPPVP